MHINVSHILAGEVGESADFELTGENPHIPDLELTRPLTGHVRITRLDDGISAYGQAELAFELECYRCLDSYQHEANVVFEGVYSFDPEEDDWPITARGVIDLAPLIRQEALVGIPIKQLCRIDCEGLCPDCGQRQVAGHKHKVQDLVSKKKGQ